MKDTIVNLLFFLLLFAGAVTGLAGLSVLYSAVVPGDYGALFANPFAFALLPALFIAAIATLGRLSHQPKSFNSNYWTLFLVVWVLLVSLIPVGAGTFKLFSPDQFPLPTGRVIEAGDSRFYLVKNETAKKPFGGQILGPVILAEPEAPLRLEKSAVFDPANQRLVVQGAEITTFPVAGESQESRYFNQGPIIREILLEIRSLFTALAQAQASPWLYILQTGILTLLLLGLFTFFSFKAFPLVKWVLVLISGRLLIWVWAYAHVETPRILAGVLPSPWLELFPEAFLLLIGVTLFWLTLLIKPQNPLGEDDA